MIDKQSLLIWLVKCVLKIAVISNIELEIAANCAIVKVVLLAYKHSSLHRLMIHDSVVSKLSVFQVSMLPTFTWVEWVTTAY